VRACERCQRLERFARARSLPVQRTLCTGPTVTPAHAAHHFRIDFTLFTNTTSAAAAAAAAAAATAALPKTQSGTPEKKRYVFFTFVVIVIVVI